MHRQKNASGERCNAECVIAAKPPAASCGNPPPSGGSRRPLTHSPRRESHLAKLPKRTAYWTRYADGMSDAAHRRSTSHRAVKQAASSDPPGAYDC